MSRLKRLKAMKIRKRNKLKTTIKCLSLTLILGFTQVLGTYALFTDSIDDLGNISISLGDLAVSADEGFTGEEISKVNTPISKKFVIENKGTLKQSLNIQLAPHITDKSILEKISYKLEPDYDNLKPNDKEFKTITTNMYALKNQGVNITSINGKGDLILLPGETLKFKATISITDENTLSKLSQKEVKFGLNVRAQQVNWNGNGFYDVYTQENSFIIKKKLGENQTEGKVDHCPCDNFCNNTGDWSKRSKAFGIDISHLLNDGDSLISQRIEREWYIKDNTRPSDAYFIHTIKDNKLYLGSANGYDETVGVNELEKRKINLVLDFKNKGTLSYMVTFTKTGDDSFISNWEKVPNPFNTEVSILPEMPQNTEASMLPEMTVVPEDIEVPTVSEETVKPDNTEVPTVSEETITPEDTEVPIVPETPQTSENTEVIPPKKEDETTL